MRTRRKRELYGSYTITGQTRDWQDPITTTYSGPMGLSAFFSDPVRQGDGKTPLPYNFVVIRVPMAYKNEKRQRFSYGYGKWWTEKHIEGATKLPLFQTLPNFATHVNGVYRATRARHNSRVETDALNKLAEQKMDIATTLAESFETANHLADRGIKLFRALSAIKRGKYNKAARIVGLKRRNLNSKVLAERWLESQYAIKPLLYDIHSLYELHKNGLRDPAALTVSSSASYPENYEFIHDLSNKNAKAVSQIKIVDKCKLFARIDNPALAAKSQLGLVSPSVVAWELVPFSFVVDWFLPVGDVLKAWSAPAGLTPLTGYYSTYVDEYITYSEEDSYRHPSLRTDLSIKGTMHVKSFSRVPSSKWPRPIPYWDADLTVGNYATLAALYQTLGAKRSFSI